MAELIVQMVRGISPADRATLISELATYGEVRQLKSVPRMVFVVGPQSAADAIRAIPVVQSVDIDSPDAISLTTSDHVFVGAPHMEMLGQMPLLIHAHSRRKPLWNSFYDLFLDGQATTYRYDPASGPGDGTGVNVYVVDSGILSTHVEFANFGSQLFDAHGDGPGTHGTSCASVAVGANIGVAPGATVYDCKSFPQSTSTSTANLVDGMDAALTHFNANSQPGVMSCSFGGTNSSNGYETVIDSCVSAGLPVVASSGNDNVNLSTTTDSENRWPAEDPDAFTVGGLDSYMRLHPSANYYGSVDMYAMYQMYNVAWSTGPSDYRTPNRTRGTSYSCPLVAGMMARALTGTTKMASRGQVEWFLRKFSVDYGVIDITDFDGTLFEGARRLYIPGVTQLSVGPYTPPVRGLA